MSKVNSLREVLATSDYLNFPFSGNTINLDCSRRLADAECVREVLEELARSRGQTNDFCDHRTVVLSED